MKRAIWLVGALLLALVPTGLESAANAANAASSPFTVSISGLDPYKTNLVSAVVNHQRVFYPKNEWTTCTVSPLVPGDVVSYTWTVEHPGALDQPALVVSNDKKYYLSWMAANPALGSFLTCRATVVRDGVTMQGDNSVFISHETPLVRLSISGVLVDASVHAGNTATCGYTANGDNSVVSFTWSVAPTMSGEGDVALGTGRQFTFTDSNLALLQNNYLICRAHSGVAPYYLDTMAAALIADRPAFRPADPGKASVTVAALPTFDLSTYLTNGNVQFGIDSQTSGLYAGSLASMTVKPGQVVSSQIVLSSAAGIGRLYEKVYDANNRLVYVIPFVSATNADGSSTWTASWTVPKATTIYADGSWQLKLAATRAADLENAPVVTIGSVGVAGIVGTQVPCSMNTGTISTQSITRTSYC
ncbi:MAG TPA: hypothetical protein VMV52_06190 [Candidatus Nanopelagicaceae bacterium]|nr:hypothetical protein [Candidatus Nanopelagicaceae bacterium]